MQLRISFGLAETSIPPRNGRGILYTGCNQRENNQRDRAETRAQEGQLPTVERAGGIQGSQGVDRGPDRRRRARCGLPLGRYQERAKESEVGRPLHWVSFQTRRAGC